MSDTETVVNELSDSDTLSDDERILVSEDASRGKPTHTAPIGRVVDRAFREKPDSTRQQKFRALGGIRPPTSQTPQTDASKTVAWTVEYQVKFNSYLEEELKEAREKDQKMLEDMRKMVTELLGDSSRKRKVGEDVGCDEDSPKRLKKRTCTCIEEF